MLERYYITLGATTTAGGRVTSASSIESIEGAAVALEGDTVACPRCLCEGIIAPDGPRLDDSFEDRQCALDGDLCLCKCTPPPRLVAAQDFSRQCIDADWHAADANAAAVNLAARGTLPPGGVALILLDSDTDAPHSLRPYRLELDSHVIEGRTDRNGATRLLTPEERAAVVAWHIDE